MNTPTRSYTVSRRDQDEPLVAIAPTTDTSTTAANGLIYALSKDTALLSRIVAAAASTGHAGSAARQNTVTRLAKILRAVTEVELSVDEADVLADDIHDAMVTPPPCEAVGCTRPEFHHGLCRDHWLNRNARIEAKARIAQMAAAGPAPYPVGVSECGACGADRCACGGAR